MYDTPVWAKQGLLLPALAAQCVRFASDGFLQLEVACSVHN